jgi:hypothetical protein
VDVRAFGSHVDQSVIADNVLTQNGASGIRVLDSTTQVLRNDARKNGWTGILLSEGENVLSLPFYVVTGNTNNDNGGAGIDATAGMTDGGGNSAKKHVATPECVNIACSKNWAPGRACEPARTQTSRLCSTRRL